MNLYETEDTYIIESLSSLMHMQQVEFNSILKETSSLRHLRKSQN